MRIENFNNNNAQNFTALKRDITMSKELFNKVIETKAVQNFGKKYDASLGLEIFQSSKPNRKGSYIALTVSDIKPANLFTKIANIFKRVNKDMVLKTHAKNENMLVENLSRQRKNILIKLCNEK